MLQMFPKPLIHFRSKQRGSMLVIALFVIVVLALLGATMTRMITASSQSTIVELSGLRALTAAQTGAQLLLQQTFPLNAPINACNTTISSTASFSGYSSIQGVQSCAFEASCTTSEVEKAGETNNYYRFSSTGQCTVGDIVVTRQVLLDAMQEQP
jgi:MSHA biogenesis protein MshP